jgi:glycosyltransferase involved in cell wall biosynthesis
VINPEPLVSIVTPTLNQGRFIEDAIRSIRQQTYPNIEHIVIDGGSTDATLEILRRDEPSDQFRWLSEPDRGMYDALDKGLRLARGEVLAYLNSDDVYPPWAVEVGVSAFLASPDLDVVFGDSLTIEIETGRQRLAFVPPFNAGSMAWTGSLVQPAVFLRRRVYERHGGFDPELRFVGDLEYWLRLGAAVRFGRVDEVLAIERTHGATLSRASAEAMAAEEAHVRERFQPRGGQSRAIQRVAARARAALWRRRLWVGFLRSLRAAEPAHGPWSRIIEHGRLTVAPGRVALSQIPRLGAPFAWNAVVSEREWFGARGQVPPSR